MKILIVDDDQDIRDIIEFSFRSEVACEITHASSGNEAIGILENSRDFSLVVCDYNMADGNGGKVFHYIKDKKLGSPFVLCSSDSRNEHEELRDEESIVGEIKKPFVFEGVVTVINNYQESYKSSKSIEKSDAAYLSVGLELLLKTKTLPCDMFVQLKNGKILKMFSQGDTFSNEEFDKYSAKGIKFLLIKREERKQYVDCFCDWIDKFLVNEEKSQGEKIFDAHATIILVVKELGLNEKIVKAVKRSVEEALNLFSESKDFKSLEKKLFKNSQNYLTLHSVAVSYIAVAILMETAWDSTETRKKLVLAGFLHDASIRVPDYEVGTFEKESNYVNFKEHPQQGQEILKKLKEIPPDLDRIILEHHERPNGTGFPRKLDGTQVHPLSAVFIFAHDIVDFVFYLKSEGQEVSDENIHRMLSINDYSIGHFNKCNEAFLEVKIFE